MEQAFFQLYQKERIRDVVRSYARGVDRRDWQLVAAAYHADGYDDHGGYKGGIPGLLEWLERRHASIDQSMHFLGNSMVDLLSETTAIAETYCVVYQRYGEQAQETIKTWLGDQTLEPGKALMAELACRYVDRFELRDGNWRIARRTVVMEEVKVASRPVLLREGYGLARRDRTDSLWQALAGDDKRGA